MYRSMGHVTLKTGETVEMGVVEGPDADWADRIEDLLAHKGDPWTWQNRSVLREDVGIEVRFYLLHRGGQALANIMAAELAEWAPADPAATRFVDVTVFERRPS